MWWWRHVDIVGVFERCVPVCKQSSLMRIFLSAFHTHAQCACDKEK